MAEEITIDAAGRLVIPKRLRERLDLRPGARLQIVEEEGRLILTPDRPEPRLVERDGFLVLDLAAGAPSSVDGGAAREERLHRLVDYALRR
jgi:AbrB family looped-hinge helix DNA binding protein